MLTVTVSQLNRYIKAVLEEDGKLSDLYIKGEISNFKSHYASGHLYFNLKDSSSTIRAVMFKGNARHLRFEPENGMAVLVRARVGVYERDGSYQLYVTDIQPEGAGALAVAFEQRKARLEAQGLFNAARKRPIPPFPRRVGIVTSQNGAALQDILTVLERRYPLCTAVVAPALVQGDEAARSIIAALEELDTRGGCDVLILGRGGGSAEDLWCFNDEALARAVYLCRTPVISAVGHETDYTICDFVADLRAPTPSAAAELTVPSAVELADNLSRLKKRMCRTAFQGLEDRSEALKYRKSRPVLQSPAAGIQKIQERLDFSIKELYNRKRIFIQENQRAISVRAALLDSLSPLRVLERGYCVTYVGGEPVSRAEALKAGDEARIRFWDGAATARIETIIREEML